MRIAIVPASGNPTNKIIANSNVPDTMVPINGKPVIGYIVEDLIDRKVNKIVIVLNEKDTQTEKYIFNKYKSKCNLSFIYNSKTNRGVGYSIYLALKNNSEEQENEILVYLGDTIYKGRLSFKCDFLVVSNQYEESNMWCFVEKKDKRYIYINKPYEYTGNGSILCGVYFFKNWNKLKKAIFSCEKKIEIIEIKHILEEYDGMFNTIKADKWYDCGNIENYYKAKIDFLKKRGFNTLIYNDLLGYLTKSSKNWKKIIDEIYWYLNVPKELQIFFPRLINYSIAGSKSTYSLEYYGYQSLADLYIFDAFHEKIWQIVIERLFKIVAHFNQFRGMITISNFNKMYLNKTNLRIAEMKKEEYWSLLFDKDKIIINGKEYKNLPSLLTEAKTKLKFLYKKQDISFLHGDMCMSNILFDVSSRIFKFIDPRGKFGKKTIYGDLKYDVAKLRHSFHEYYDFIIADLFELNEINDKAFTYKIYINEKQKKIGELFDQELVNNGYILSEIKLIEGLLFISMLPIHSDNKKRQKAMFLNGITLLNEAL